MGLTKGFLCNTGPDPQKNHKATKPAFNVGTLSARQGNVIEMLMMVQHIECWLGSFVIIIAEKPYIFVIFQVGSPTLDPLM